MLVKSQLGNLDEKKLSKFCLSISRGCSKLYSTCTFDSEVCRLFRCALISISSLGKPRNVQHSGPVRTPLIKSPSTTKHLRTKVTCFSNWIQALAETFKCTMEKLVVSKSVAMMKFIRSGMLSAPAHCN